MKSRERPDGFHPEESRRASEGIPSKRGSQELLARNKCYEDFIILSNTIRISSFYFQLSEVIRRKTIKCKGPRNYLTEKVTSGAGES